MFCRIVFTNISRFDDIIRNCITSCIYILSNYVSTNYWIFCINVSHCLFLTSELARCRTLNFFEAVSWNSFLVCRIVFTNISRFDDIIRNCITSCIYILSNYVSTNYWIFCINVSHCLFLTSELARCRTLNFFEAVSWNSFLVCRIVFTNISRFDDIIRNCITSCIYILSNYVSTNYWIFFVFDSKRSNLCGSEVNLRNCNSIG